MRIGRRCLAISVYLLAAIGLWAQEPEYYYGYGSTMREAKNDLIEKLLNSDVQVAKHTVLRDKDGKQDYDSYTGVDSGIIIPQDGIELIQEGGNWMARIEKTRVQHTDANWKVENITINNTYNEAPTYSRGFKRTTSTTRTTRRTDIKGPSGNVVRTTRGKTTTTTTHRNWNGRYGYTWSKSKTE